MVPNYLESALWGFTIMFTLILASARIRRSNKLMNKNFTPFTIITIPVCLTILLFFSFAFFMPQKYEEIRTPLVNNDGKGTYEKIGDNKIRITLYSTGNKNLGYLDLNSSDVIFKDTDSPSYFNVVHHYYSNPITGSILRFLESESYELYVNKEQNMTMLYQDGFLYPAGYTETDIKGLDKIKKELDSLEKQLAGEKEEQ